jgi:hypothetical protein
VSHACASVSVSTSDGARAVAGFESAEQLAQIFFVKVSGAAREGFRITGKCREPPSGSTPAALPSTSSAKAVRAPARFRTDEKG